MKRTALFSIFILLIVLVLPACQEDEWTDWKLLNEEWLENNKNDSNVITTSSGLQYKVIYQGTPGLRKPNSSSVVKIKYTGKLIDGSEFDSSDAYTTSLSYMVDGFIEGLKKMNNQGRYILYIPSNLGYDDSEDYSDIPPYSTLIFDVELLDSYN